MSSLLAGWRARAAKDVIWTSAPERSNLNISAGIPLSEPSSPTGMRWKVAAEALRNSTHGPTRPAYTSPDKPNPKNTAATMVAVPTTVATMSSWVARDNSPIPDSAPCGSAASTLSKPPTRATRVIQTARSTFVGPILASSIRGFTPRVPRSAKTIRPATPAVTNPATKL